MYSEPGMGTTFKVYLPMIKEIVKEDEESASPPAEGGTETVLLGEDDTLVRQWIKDTLTMAGYTVIEAVNGEDLSVLNSSQRRTSIWLSLMWSCRKKMDGKPSKKSGKNSPTSRLFS